MQISNCGYNFRHPADFGICRPHGSGDCILLVLRSRARFFLDGEERLAPANSVVLFSEGTPQIYGGCGEEYINDWVHFTPSGEDVAWIKGLGIEFDRILELSGVLSLSSLIEQMCAEMYSKNKNASDSAHLLFRLLILKLSDLLARRERGGDPRLLEQLLRLRTEIFSEPWRAWGIEEIAKELSLSASYLQHLYKRQFLVGIKEDVTAARMEYAKYLLFSTDDAVATVSRLCGYRSDVHFLRTFKRRVGMTPTEYRNHHDPSHEKLDHAKQRPPYSL